MATRYKWQQFLSERRAKNETDRRSADPHADTDDCRLWTVEVAAHDPMGMEEADRKRKEL